MSATASTSDQIGQPPQRNKSLEHCAVSPRTPTPLPRFERSMHAYGIDLASLRSSFRRHTAATRSTRSSTRSAARARAATRGPRAFPAATPHQSRPERLT